jgi:DNA primase
MRLSDELRQSLELAASRYQAAIHLDVPTLPDSPALSYLLGRGISRAAADAYHLGVVDGSIPEHAPYTGWISIPYLTRLGGVVQIKFRRLSGDGPKYVGSGGSPRLYNTPALDRADSLGYVALCEGEFDAIILDALCGIPAVAIPGVDTWASRPEWREIFQGYSRVLVFADQDEPGRKLASRILHDLDTAQLVSLPAKDVNDAFLQFGAGKIKELAGV